MVIKLSVNLREKAKKGINHKHMKQVVSLQSQSGMKAAPSMLLILQEDNYNFFFLFVM